MTTIKNSFCILIPARLKSKRFPNKMLSTISGIPMIEYVRRRSKMIKGIKEVIVTSSDKKILQIIKSYGGKTIKTSNKHKNGTSRISEACRNLNYTHFILIQGDEPLIVPTQIQSFVKYIKKNINYSWWNMTSDLSKSDFNNESVVKCLKNRKGVIYSISRKLNPKYLKHTKSNYIKKIQGILAFEKNFLKKYKDLNKSFSEKTESIEQSRFIENLILPLSFNINTATTSVNFIEDMILVKRTLKKNPLQKKLNTKTIKNF